jgi:hypothetical protein
MTDTAQLRGLLAKMTPGEWGAEMHTTTIVVRGGKAKIGTVCNLQARKKNAIMDAVGIAAFVNAAEPMLDELERLREALEFYADPEMWTPHKDASAPIDLDAGKIARAAIAAAKGA